MSFRDRDRGRPQEPPLPKPYEFVPLPEALPALKRPAGHQRYMPGLLSGTLTGTLTARSPVHVASGLLEPADDRRYPLVKGHFRTGGRPAIPATSLKGCIRSIVEAISRSAVQVTRARELPREYTPQRGPERLDVAQRLFGALGYLGAVRFADAPLAAGETVVVPTPPLYRPRPESIGTYFEGRRPHGRKFYMHGRLARGDLPLEACPEESRFALRADFDNLSAGELGLLLIGLGLGEPRLWPKLGGGKPACLGTVEVGEVAVALVDTRGAYADLEPAPAAPADLAALVGAAHAEGLVLGEQLAALAAILRWPRDDRSCPDRVY